MNATVTQMQWRNDSACDIGRRIEGYGNASTESGGETRKRGISGDQKESSLPGEVPTTATKSQHDNTPQEDQEEAARTTSKQGKYKGTNNSRSKK